MQNNSLRYSISLTKKCLKIWWNMHIAQIHFHRNLAVRTLFSLRKLMYLRKKVRLAFFKGRKLALLLSTRLQRISGIALKKYFILWHENSRENFDFFSVKMKKRFSVRSSQTNMNYTEKILNFEDVSPTSVRT